MHRRVLGTKRIVFLAAAILFLSYPHAGSQASASPRATGSIVSNQVSQELPALRSGSLTQPGLALGAGDTGSTGDPTPLFTSDVVAANQLFDRIVVHWIAKMGTEESLFFEARVSPDGAAWGEWVRLQPDEDTANLETNHYYAPPLAVDGASRFAQYRVWLTGGDPDAVAHVGVVFMDVTDRNLGPVGRFLNDLEGAVGDFLAPSVANAATGVSKIRTRQEWGADEALMRWTPQYQKKHTKAVIHHTVTDDGGSNVAATIRSMYHYHAVTLGWGDIGYNYLVDKFGNIWTGRAGGDHVIGGHTYGWNDGAFGVAAIGDYSVAQPTSAMQGAIANIIAIKFAQYGIQPFGNDTFTHKEQRSDGTWIDVTGNPPNMQGHRDSTYIVGKTGGLTACPGNAIYNMLDGLRTLTQSAVNAGFNQLVRFEPVMPSGTFPGSSLNIPVTVTNRGVNPIPAGTTVSYQVVRNGAVVVAQGGSAPIPTAIPSGGSAVISVPLSGPSQGMNTIRWDLQTSGVWWNQLYNTPSRDVSLRSADWSADWRSDNIPASFTAGETRTVTATLRNDGGRVWNATGTNPVVVTYTWTSVSTGNKFPGANKIALASDVSPGQTVSVNLPVTAPAYPTNYTLTLDLEKTNEFKFGDRGIDVDNTSIAVLPDYKVTYNVTPTAFAPGATTMNVPVTVTNTGKGILPVSNSTPIALGYHWYSATGGTLVYDSPRTRLPADLQPGQSVQLVAQVNAPPSGGTHRLAFDLVQEGVAWFSTKGMPTGDLTVTVAGPVVRNYGASYQPSASALAVSGSQTAVLISVTNNGNFTWPASGANPVNLSYHWSRTDGSTVIWEGLRAKLPSDVAPGQTVALNAQVAVPQVTGTFLLRWDLVEEGVSWFSGKGVTTFNQNVAVETPRPYAYGSSMLPTTPATMPTHMTQQVPVRIQNLSSHDWDGSINLSYHWYDSSGRAVVWDGLRTSLSGVARNQVRDVVATVAAPTTPGAYTLRWDIVREGFAWFSTQGVQMPSRGVQVSVPQYGALYAPQASLTVSPGSTVTAPLSMTNTGSLAWDSAARFALSYHVYNSAGSVVQWEGLRTALSAPVGTGQVTTMNAVLTAPAAPGTYTVRFDLVQEGVTWFSGQGVPAGSMQLVVQ